MQFKKKKDKRENPFRSNFNLADQLAWTEQRTQAEELLDRDFGYNLLTPGPPRLGFLLKMSPTTAADKETGASKSALALYFLQGDGSCFKCVKPYDPYFYIYVKEKYTAEVEEFLRRQFGKEITSVAVVDKEDLELLNHLSGLQRRYLRISFATVAALLSVRGRLMTRVRRNRKRLGIEETYGDGLDEGGGGDAPGDVDEARDYGDYIYDIREYDVTYYQRVAIDLGFRVGLWYEVRWESGHVVMEPRREILDRPRLKVMAFDIEVTHAPMRFPDAEVDMITMMSYMIDQQGYLIVNRELVAEDIMDFEYTPKPEFYGPFRIFNERNEAACLRRFFSHARAEKPHVYVSFNGDGFDWPFIEARAKFHGIVMADEIGIRTSATEEFTCHYASHLDCFRWVVRDSYLPAGSQGLKAVTKAKLGYDPLELDPEDMVRFATEKPQVLASYSVSDAVATYYLYQNYVHPFIYSLCTIIPMHPDDVLRKGSGTLCEALLMVQATLANVIYPNKSTQEPSKMHKGHLIESETYIGGHVESLAAGVFRSDIPMKFEIDVATIDSLLGRLDATLKFAIETDGKGTLDAAANYDEVRNSIANMLQKLKDVPSREDKPLLYHLDVGAMYPNIILTNRLQPSAIVDEMTCAACDFNKPENNCQRKQNWTWRGEVFPANQAEFELVRTQLESEKFPAPHNPEKTISFFQLPYATQNAKLRQRLKDYCKRVYKKTHVTLTEDRADTVCMRENSFYVDTVRLFRDRRYEYKASWTTWKGKLAKAQQDNDAAAILKAKEMVIIFESLQIAHKCILNSFYGYVMRRGARWFSMKMAGMVTKTGAEIIQRTRELVERVGIPLELDTDGIWCALPCTFPENFKITWKDPARRPFSFSYICEVLNHMVNMQFTNDQYQTLISAPGVLPKQYDIRSENSIFFEVDGPYRAMMLPASSEEGKTLKKRYAVFREDGTLAELKGFELKRRGELNLIKIFQGKIFETYLRGKTLEEAYQEVGRVADQWLDILYNKGRDMDDEELIDLISSSSSMSKSLAEYGEGKSNAITTAKRLGEFLGPQMVANKGLACKYIISKEPVSAPVTERAIPVVIFSAERSQRNWFIRRWIQDTSKSFSDYGIRDILDWDYYIARFAKTLQKLCTIPAAMQGVPNPLPRVADPEWLKQKKVRDADPRKQRKIDSLFQAVPRAPKTSTGGGGGAAPDIENLADVLQTPAKRLAAAAAASQRENGDGEVLPGSRAKRQLVVDDDDEAVVAVVDNVENRERNHAGLDLSLRAENYSDWLQNVKKFWTHQRVDRNKRRASVITPQGRQLAPRYVVRTYKDRSRFRFACQPWQVLQIVETAVPGEFDVWAIVGSEGMRRLRVLCPRRLLINSVVPDADRPGAFPWDTKRVVLRLPHNKPVSNLYEVCIPESLFQRSYRDLNAAFLNPEVLGVFESRSSLLFHSMLSLGICLTVDTFALARDADDLPLDAFRASHLVQNAVSSEFPYVDPSQLKHIYLYHSCMRDQSRGCFAVFLPDGGQQQVQVVLYSSQRVDSVRVEDFLKEKLVGKTVMVKKVTRRDLACKLIEKTLKGFHTLAYCEPCIVCLQTTVPDAQLANELPSLTEFPVVRLVPNEQDNQYEAKGTAWEMFAANCVSQRQTFVADWLAKQIAFAAYANVPLANFSLEHPSFAADVLFHRALKKNGLVSWASDNNRPDLGGAEEDNNILFTDIENPEIVNPGCFDTVCIELSLFNLALNAILQSHLINLAEGGQSLAATAPAAAPSSAGQSKAANGAESSSSSQRAAGAAGKHQNSTGLASAKKGAAAASANGNGNAKGAADATAPSDASLASGGAAAGGAANSAGPDFELYDDTSDCVPAFMVLKALVNQWTVDIGTRDNPNEWAEHLLHHVYNWISSPRSKMYDPSLHRLVHVLMKKVFMQLLHELKRLGAKVVYATFNQIIIATNKKSLSDATAYWEFIHKTLFTNELFFWIKLETSAFWDVLLFQDITNYGGVASSPQDENSQSEPRIVSNWNVADYLSAPVGQSFVITVSEYLMNLWNSRPLLEAQQQQQHQQHPQDKEKEKEDTKRSRAGLLITSDLTQRLFQVVTKLHRNPTMHAMQQRMARKLPGLDEKYAGNAALQFVATVCHVLALDKDNSVGVANLRRDLLKLVGFDDFDPNTEFRDPAPSFVVQDVICEFCNNPHNLDLLRDPSMLRHDWSCTLCAHQLNKLDMETTLVERANAMCLAYWAQDLVCAKCRLVRAESLSLSCPTCSGQFVLRISQQEMQKNLATLKLVATFHGMTWLESVLSGLLQSV